MYKTIRHGENSLQYTILPQNDDFRIEGKLTGSAAACSSSSSSSSAAAACKSSKRSSTGALPRRRRSFFAYLGLIFVCTVIIGAVLIPFLVSAECLPNPTEWFLKTKAALTQHSPHTATVQGVSGSQIQTNPNEVTPSSLLSVVSDNMLVKNVGKSVQIVNRNGVEQFVLKLNKNSTMQNTDTTASPITTTASTSSSTTTTTTSSTTTTTTTTPLPAMQQESSIQQQQQQRLQPISTITTRIIQVPLLKSAAKKPIMPPVLAKTQSLAVQNETRSPFEFDLSQNKSNAAWIKTHWAYIDPSTYFQWTGYKAEDSVLLPALLGFALIGMILIITVCLVARNKRTIVSSVRNRNRNDIEEQGAEDNATLLTTTNLSDDD
ncbi:uncharacterized protein Dwil_GK24970 [Drosophila willistoni]|uniref:Uncharacterized protein n=1 Tax=Drosophila willistoni TaxID=7260 RepID=B4ND59_DROWI|nr:uncharacterized protein Dwil_GK24970 [Drosophila willistoni]